MCAEDIRFSQEFKALTGHDHFPWQLDLYRRFTEGDFPKACNIPTGLGKTSVIPIWIISLARGLNEKQVAKVPRRLIYVVNRRTVVDQATDEAVRLRHRLVGRAELNPTEREILGELRQRLVDCSAVHDRDVPIAISTLRGEFADNAEWRIDPARPGLVVGTVDMIGSRLLFSGYGVGFKTKPLHAAFLGQDALLVHDEAHLEPAFQELLTAIADEQQRCNEVSPFRVMALTATTRGGGQPFGLTQEERNVPEAIPDPPKKPIDVVWRRLKATKLIRFHKPEGEKEKVADRIGKLAKKCGESHPGTAILVFVNSLEDHATVCKALGGENVQALTGTLRGLERDKLAKEDPIFARFLPHAPSDGRTVYLVCTSAGEVGIDISADHMVCDLTTFDRMAQRLGRVNRFGNGDAEIEVAHEPNQEKDKKGDPRDQARWRTLELLQTLPRVGRRYSCSPLDLVQLREREDLQSQFALAFTPLPEILPVSDILFDSWALTSVRSRLPGRPPVEPYLHGVADWEPPETHVAWREEVEVITENMLDSFSREDLIEDYPLKPHELLRDRTDRVFKHLRALAGRNPEAPTWLLDDDGDVEAVELGQLADERSIRNCTVLLAPKTGGLSNGLLDGESDTADDVSYAWLGEDDRPRRVRVWDDDPDFDSKTSGMRLIRRIAFSPLEGQEEGDEGTGSRCWFWYEFPGSGESGASKSSKESVAWQVHTDDVVRNAEQITQRLAPSDHLGRAVMVAARFHDLGKKRKRFQQILGNMAGTILLAKSGKKRPAGLREDYRHELGSLLDVENEREFRDLSEDEKDLVLHCIAAHHGRGRPHFPPEETFDPEPNGLDVSGIAAEVPRRFARLQRKYGRWGLAYIESLLRAADYAASANPSSFVEEDREH